MEIGSPALPSSPLMRHTRQELPSGPSMRSIRAQLPKTTTHWVSDGTVREQDRKDDNDHDVNDEDEDEANDWLSETDYPLKVTVHHVLFMAKERRTSMECGTYGPVKRFVDEIFGRRGFRHSANS